MYKIAEKRLQVVYNDLVNQLNQRNVSVVGLGQTAFNRSGFLGIVKDFRVLCIKESVDLESIRDKFPVYSLERDFGNPTIPKMNTTELLKVAKVSEHLSQIIPPICLFVYKSSKAVEKQIENLSVELLSSSSEIREPFEDKWEFRKIAKVAGITLADGKQFLIDDFNLDSLISLQKEFGKVIVLQLTDYTMGGGIGTFFVKDEDDYDNFCRYVEKRRLAGRSLDKLNATKFVKGESASITACVSRHGVFTGVVQRQLVDIEGVSAFYGRRGVFAGHEWGDFYSETIQRKAEEQAKLLGSYMFKNGYRGIFGIDFVVDNETDEVTVIECNSRYTGAFPVYTMLQRQAGEIPIDLWHLLEFYHMDYDVDFDLVQESYRTVKYGAQLILHNLERSTVVVSNEVKSGVYALKDGKISYKRRGFELSDIHSDSEFIFTDGVPVKGSSIKPGHRIGRLLFSKPVSSGQGKALRVEYQQIVSHIYNLLGFEKT